MALRLPRPLAPGYSAVMELDSRFTVPPETAPRTGHRDREVFLVAQWYPQVAMYGDLLGRHFWPYLGAGEFYLTYGDFDVAITVPEDLAAGIATRRAPGWPVDLAVRGGRCARFRVRDLRPLSLGFGPCDDRSGRRVPVRGQVHARMAPMIRATARSSAVAVAALVLLLDGCAIPRWPVDAPVTSPYGIRMVGLRPRIHHGVDLGVPEGTPVRAMTRGRVAFAGPMGGYGLTVIVEHRRGVSTLYAHLSEISVRAGERVGPRQVIGRAGQTGAARGAHLHFEIRRRGRVEDPVPLLGGPPRAARR